LLEGELRAFMQNFGKGDLSEREHLHSLFISWVSVFIPEAVPPVFRQELKQFVNSIRLRQDFLYNSWWRVLPLNVALFSLEGDYMWLDMHRLNIDHHKSSLRLMLLESLALVSDQLDLHDGELQVRIAHNLKVVHGHCDWCVLLLLTAQGSPQAKKDLLKVWIQDYGKHLNRGEKVVLEQLLKGEPVSNPFLSQFLWIQQYVCLRMAEARPENPAQMPLFHLNNTNIKPEVKCGEEIANLEYLYGANTDAETQPGSNHWPAPRANTGSNGDELPLGLRLWHRQQSHPLMKVYIQLEEA
jgi:hypothetical protein